MSQLTTLPQGGGATAGSVKVTESTSTHLAAEFDPFFGANGVDHVTGSFSSDLCAGTPARAARTTEEFFAPFDPNSIPSSTLSSNCKR